MAAQLEDGYTRVANEIMDCLMKFRLNGTQHSIIYCVIRNTYGFHRKSHAMSLTFIATATGIHKDLIKRELDKLIESKVVRVYKEAGFRTTREIGINSSTVDWEVNSETKRRQSTKQSTVSESVGEQSPKQSTPTVDESVYQERKSFKDIKDTTTTTADAISEIQSGILQMSSATTTSDIHTKVFGTLMMNGLMQDYVRNLMAKGFTDHFIQELMLETGESGNKPSLRLMQTIGERWIKEGIYTRIEAKRRKESSKTDGFPKVHKTSVAKRDSELRSRDMEIARNKWIESGGNPDEFEFGHASNH